VSPFSTVETEGKGMHSTSDRREALWIELSQAPWLVTACVKGLAFFRCSLSLPCVVPRAGHVACFHNYSAVGKMCSVHEVLTESKSSHERDSHFWCSYFATYIYWSSKFDKSLFVAVKDFLTNKKVNTFIKITTSNHCRTALSKFFSNSSAQREFTKRREKAGSRLRNLWLLKDLLATSLL
jgi:hypothetical protein